MCTRMVFLLEQPHTLYILWLYHSASLNILTRSPFHGETAGLPKSLVEEIPLYKTRSLYS